MIRKCLAAQKGACIKCNYSCPSCGVRKYSINEECQLCNDCEEKELKRVNMVIEDLKNSKVTRKQNLVITVFGE